MKNKIFVGIIIISSIVAPSCGKHGVRDERMAEETIDVAYPQVDSIVLRNTYPGHLNASNQVEVVGRVNGLLVAQCYKDGSHVDKGQVLFRIEDGKYRDAVQKAQAALTTAISTRDYAKTHYEAVKKALESDAVSKMEVSQALSAYQQAEASIKSARASLESPKTNLGYCTVIAPISGMASASTFDVGNYISGEGAPVTLTTIYDNTVLTANFSIEDEKFLDLMRDKNNPDAPKLTHIPLTFSDSIAHKYFGDLTYMAPALNTSTGTLTLKCHVKNTYDELRPGMFVKVDLPYKKLDNAVLVKDASISTDQSGKYLYAVDDSNRIVYTPIEAGPLYHDSLRVVFSGITPKQRYVTKALLKVRNGMEVNPRVVK